ncbi:MAG: response regulator [Eubacteriales bacterium]|nr:response regulator [Eubacteriales bacterium]
MKLLIVDDDLHVIQGIQRNINWERAGITQTFCALGVLAAKKILLQEQVDIMISDIEMPRETGFDLLEWLRQAEIELQVIFLTSYANFEYAQRAIQFNIQEYILKPVNYIQLEEAIIRAVAGSASKKQSRMWKENNEYWEQNRQNIIEHFWRGVLSGDIVSQEQTLTDKIEACGLQYMKETVFLPVVIQKVHDAKGGKEVSALAAETGSQWFSARNSLIQGIESVVKVRKNTCIMLLKTKMHVVPESVRKEVHEFVRLLVEESKENGTDIICGVGMWSTVELVYEDVKCIYNMLYESPRSEQALYLREYEPVNMMYEVPDLKNWWEMMRAGELEKLKAAVRKYLGIVDGQKKLSSRNLQQLGLDITQMVYSYLGEMNIYAHMLFDNEENNSIYGRAALSSANMMQYLEYLLKKTMEYKDMVEQPQSIVGIIKEYMDNHYQENISREDLSRLVYLNPDYLSRLFKKETGMSLSGYLIQKRIQLAKELLVSSKMPVSVVSAQVGYDNFAYFTKIFKERTGMAPNEYRKRYQKGK